MPIETHICEHCNIEFSYERIKKRKRFCSNSCKHKAFYRKTIGKYDATRLEWNKRNRLKPWLYDIKKRAKKKNIEFNLSEEDLFIPELCPVLNVPLFSGGAACNNSPSLDRINPTKGYTKDNVRVISMRANMLKSNATVEELELVLKDLKRLSTTHE